MTTDQLRKSLETVDQTLSSQGLTPEYEPIPVYEFRTSLLVFISAGLLAVLLPGAGLWIAGIAWLLLAREIVSPLLARVKPGQSQNLTVTIPARSKEFQRVVIIIPAGGSNLLPAAGFLPETAYWATQLLLGLAAVICHALKLPLGPACSLAPLAAMAVLTLLGKRAPAERGFDGMILTELAAILSKARPATTSVVFRFTGTGSLNSGILDLPKQLKTGPELTYIVNLAETDDQALQLLDSEGPFGLKADLFMRETLTEAASEKGIELATIRSSAISRVLPLKFKKYPTVTLRYPKASGNAVTARNFRELLAGFIRRIEG